MLTLLRHWVLMVGLVRVLPLVFLCLGSAGMVRVAGSSKEDLAARHVAVLRVRPEDAAARQALRRLFTEEYPARLPADIAAHFPLPHQVCEDAIVAFAPAQRSLFTTGLAFPAAAHRQAPGGGQRVNRVLHGYVQDPAGGAWRLRFRVLYREEDDGAAALAPRTMRALLRVHAAFTAMLGDGQRALPRVVNVWLQGDGDGGAEQSGPHLYLHGTGIRREPIELLRQIAHEFGHLALPAIGPLEGPERWGNGFLGEALLLRWLARAPAEDDPLVSREALAAHVRQEVAPLAQFFAAAGWEAFAGRETSAEGLRLVLGMVLRLEDTQGAGAVARLTRTVQGAGIGEWVAVARDLMGGEAVR